MKKLIMSFAAVLGSALTALSCMNLTRTQTWADAPDDIPTSIPDGYIGHVAADDTPYEPDVDYLTINGLETEAVTEATVAETTTTTIEEVCEETEPAIPTVTVDNLTAEAVSVSCIKVMYESPDHDLSFTVKTDAPFQENITFLNKEPGLMYITGLRENSEYTIIATPTLAEDEVADVIPAETTVRTEQVTVIYDFEYVDGWTGCFCGERAGGLTAMPSSGAIYGSQIDTITDTGIRRFDNGDYCVAMGTHYGYCNDRFLVEMDNGTQFTVRICDSKGAADVQDDGGYGMWHWFGYGAGKCIIEMIYDSDGAIPGCVRSSGSWGGFNWNGLNLGGNIASIKKINY